MKRAHAVRHRHLAAQRKAASSRMDRRIERDAHAKEAARRERQAKDRRRADWDCGALPLLFPALGTSFGMGFYNAAGATGMKGLTR